ncbi:MAG: UDP-N-acetylmuramate--L-alanine ligase [Alphaproteobacteria bacterium]
MQISPEHVGILHFIGIGGIGMSGIAEILHASGYQVRGSDSAHNSNVERLERLGIPISIGQKAENVMGASVVVASSAIKDNNPELIKARDAGMPVVWRSEMLAEIMRLKPGIAIAGSHGKTTSTSLLAHIMSFADMDPTIVSGGIINSLGTNARLGSGKWVIAEADESDGSFVKLPATIAVITNIDQEHMDHYGDFATLKKSFREFITKIPFYGLGVLCIDDQNVRDLTETITDRRTITVGLSEDAHIRAEDIIAAEDRTTFTVSLHGPAHDLRGAQDIHETTMILPMIGTYNIQNALGVIAAALECGIDLETISSSLLTFKGVQRRFTKVGAPNGVTIIDDYAHHPIEIQRVLEAAKNSCSRRVIAVVQPHRFSRLSNLFKEFAECTSEAHTVVVLPVHTAGEKSIEGIDHQTLASAMRDNGHNHVIALDSADDLAATVSGIAAEGDYVICMGAGSITGIAAALPDQLHNNNGPASDQAFGT